MSRWLIFVASTLVLSCSTVSDAPEDPLERARSVLAQLEGEISLPGLREPVEVLRDRWGVAHIYAKNQDDLFFAQGFVAAQDRLFQIDLWRRVARGETAEVLGPEALVRDRFARLMKYRGDLDAEWASYSPDTKRIATAFTQGINSCIEHLGERLPVEFQLLGYKPGKWQPEDCLGRMSVLQVAFNLRREIARAELVQKIGVDKARQAMPTDPEIAFAPAPGVDLEGVDSSLLAGYSAVVQPIEFEGGGPDEASNNWAVDSALSASGKPMLASDPHRYLTLPSLRYLVHLNGPGWNVIGGGEPALPGVAIGHNERIAWGFTVVLTDQADVFVEETNPENPNQYKVGDHWEDFEVVRETVRIRNAEPEELELRFSRNGPVFHEDRERHRAYALRWVGSEPGTAAYLGALAVDRAGNQAEFLEAMKAWKTPSENIVYADVDGNIGWVAAALTPVRKGGHGLLPAPGAGTDHRWERFLEVEELPQIFNPPEHFVATANQKILPPGYPHEISFDWAASYRYRRVRQRLESKKKFTLGDFRSMQYDNVSIPGGQLARLVGEVGIEDPELAPFVELMSRWDGSLRKESGAAALYAVWLRELTGGFFGPHVPEILVNAARSRNGMHLMMRELLRPTASWFGEDAQAERDRLVRETFRGAVEKLKTKLGEDPDRWAWGQLHHVLFRHPLSGRGDAYAKAFDVGPLSSGSGPYTPDQARSGADFRRRNGATYRHVLDLADWDRGLATSAPGQSGQPGSPHYADLVSAWAKGEYFPLAFSREKVEEVTAHRLVLSPMD